MMCFKEGFGGGFCLFFLGPSRFLAPRFPWPQSVPLPQGLQDADKLPTLPCAASSTTYLILCYPADDSAPEFAAKNGLPEPSFGLNPARTSSYPTHTEPIHPVVKLPQFN